MKIELDLEGLDFDNIENVKQVVINNFNDHGLSISKLRTVKGGLFIYHKAGMVSTRKVRTLVEESDTQRTYSVRRKEYTSDFISTESLESFKINLEIIIQEAKQRKGVK